MNKEKRLSIHTQKNWAMGCYTTFIGVVFMFMFIGLFVYGDVDWDWYGILFFVVLFIFAIFASFALPYLILTKEKILVFRLTDKSLIMSDSSNKDRTDFNKSVPLAEIKKFYHKKNIKWGGFSEFVNGLFYLNTAKQEKLFLDLTLEVKIKEESIEKIIQFVRKGTKPVALRSTGIR